MKIVWWFTWPHCCTRSYLPLNLKRRVRNDSWHINSLINWPLKSKKTRLNCRFRQSEWQCNQSLGLCCTTEQLFISYSNAAIVLYSLSFCVCSADFAMALLWKNIVHFPSSLRSFYLAQIILNSSNWNFAKIEGRFIPYRIPKWKNTIWNLK